MVSACSIDINKFNGIRLIFLIKYLKKINKELNR